MRTLLLCACVALDIVLNGTLAKMFSGPFDTFCAAQIDGQVYSWGYNAYGQLGNGASAHSSFPVKMLNVHNATDVSAGYYHTCIVDQGKIQCAGDGKYLSHSSGSTNNVNILVDVEGVDYSVETVDQVFASQKHSCLVTSVGAVKCWGADVYGQLGNEGTVHYGRAFPVTGFETSGASTVALGYSHTCLLNIVGKVYCAGFNYYGQLGRGTANENWNAVIQPITGEEHVMVSILLVRITSAP